MNNIYKEICEKCCPYCDAECDGCWLEELINEELAEERKKVVQEIREWCKESFDYTKLPNELGCWVAVNREEFFNILDQIERGGNNENKRN